MDPGTATLDAALLAAGAVVVDELLRDAAHRPVLVGFGGDWPDDLPGAVADVLRTTPALTVAIDPPASIASDAFDLVLDAARVPAIAAAFARAPIAAIAAAVLLREPPDTVFAGLVAESATYSTLQSGPEFAGWRASRAAKAIPDPEGDRVRVELHDDVTEIVLARADRHNAVDVRMRDALHGALVDARRRDAGIVLRGEGPSFCSGGDLDEFGSFPDPALAHLVRLDRSLALAVAAIADRLVVAIHGACLGAGIELPAFARTVVAADDTRVGLPEQSLGLVPGAGGTVSIPRRCGRHATLGLLLSDGTIPAPRALELGLVDEIVAADDLRDRALALARAR